MKHLSYLGFLLLNFLFAAPSLTFAQLVLERDINTEPSSSQPSEFTELDGFLYFKADDGIHGNELFRYNLEDGTAELVADIRPFDESSDPVYATAFDGRVFFSARDGNGTLRHLLVYDPVEDTTMRFRDANFLTVREPSNLFVFNNQLFFSAEFSGSGREPGRYDPVSNEVVMLADINPSGNSTPSFFTEAGGKLWFSANDDISNSRLWQYDPDTDEVTRIDYASPNDVYPNLNFLYHFDGRIYFRGNVSGQGTELHVYDIATNSLLDISEIYPGPASSNPGPFISYDGKIYFPARTAADGRELRVLDPNDNSISLFHDFVADGNGNPGISVVLNDVLYSTANDEITEERNLYAYEAGGTVTKVAGLEFDGNPNFLNILWVSDEKIFLYGRDLDHGTELFSYTPGENTIDLAADINQTTIGSFPYQFTDYNGKLYFGAEEPLLGREVWVYNPANGQTNFLTSAPGNTSPYGFTALDNKLFFGGIDPNAGYGLLYYDDATGQVSPTSYITPGQGGHISEVIAYNDKLFFVGRTPDNRTELFVYNPQTNEASIVTDINPDDGSNPSWLYVFDGKLFFTAISEAHGSELWYYDDTEGTVNLAADINPGDGHSSPGWLTAYNNQLYFSAFLPETSYELYSYDPVTETATQRTNVSGNINPEFLAVYQNKLYMKGRLTSQEGTELLFYDAEADTIQLAADIGPGSSNPMWLTVFRDNLYFAATTDEFGTELWEYDGENAVIYTDIYQGVPGSNPEWLTVFNNKLYFSANDGEKGPEIWSLAGCINVFVDAEPVYHPDSLGAVSLTIEGGTPPYSIQWSNGSTDQNPGDLPPGEYTLVVTDDTGCIVKLRVEIAFIDLTNTPEITVEESVVAYPNPGNGNFTIDWGALQPKEVLVFDMQGRLVLNQQISVHETESRIILQGVKSGTYFLQLRTADNVIYKKVVVN